MKYIKLTLIFFLILLFTGCYNYRELNDLGITTAIGISKENNNYKITVEVLKTEESSTEESKAPKYVLFEATGKTLQEASRKVILESSKRLYINHLQILIIDEDLAKEGINEIMDIFFRDPESRKQFYVLISKVDINTLMNTEGLLETLNSKSITDRLKANKNYLSSTTPITFSKLLTKYINPNKEITLPSLNLIENKTLNDELPKYKIIIDETAIFKKDKLVGYINNDNALYLNLIENEVHDTILTTMNDNNYITIEINDSNTDIKTKNLIIEINIKLSGNIAEINDVNDLTNPDTISDIEKLFENYLNKEIYNMIQNIIEKYDTDIFGFKDIIYKLDNEHFNDKIDLKDIGYIINTNVKLKYKGNGAYELNEE